MEVVLAHANCDFDSLASQLAVTKLYPGVRMVPGYPLAANIKGFLALYRDALPLIDLQYTDLTKVLHVYIVDCQQKDRLDEVGKKLLAGGECTYTIFDHHKPDPKGLGSSAREDSIVRPAGACTTLLVDKLREQNLALTTFEATLLLLGIYEDTGCLTYGGTTEVDARCVAYLLGQGADLNQLNSFMNPKLDHQQTELFQVLLANSKTVSLSGAKVVVAHASCTKYIEGLATLTRRLLELASADAAFTVVFMRDRIYVVGRSDHRAISVRDVVRAFGGDGHCGAASAAVKNGSIDEILTRLDELLREHARPEVKASDIMIAPVPTIRADVTMDEAGRIMLRYSQDGLVVVEETGIIGIVSRRDVDKAVHHKLAHAPARGFMSRPVITITEDTPLSEIQATMVKHDIGRLPVLDHSGVLQGLVTRKEVLKTLYGVAAPDDTMSDLVIEKRRLHFRKKLDELESSKRWLFQEIGRVAERIGMVAYAVGGCVRDLILSRENFDLDFVIEGSAIQLAEALEAAYPGRFELVAKHDRFQTATVAFFSPDRLDVDLSTARVEYYEFPAALPTVEASRLEQDLFRRDFTINALAVCVNPDEYGDVIDFFDGISDIHAKTIRVLHQFSFIEDPTRIVRAVRFASRLGFSLEPKTRQQAERAINMGIFEDLGGSRLKEELRLILESAERLRALDLLNELGGGLKYLAKDLVYDHHVRRILRRAERLLARNPVDHDWVVYLGLLLSGLSCDRLVQVMDHLHLANDEKTWITAGLRLPEELHTSEGAKGLTRSQIYQRLHGSCDQTLAIAACLSPPLSPVRRWIKLYLDELRSVSVAISGHDLLRMGFPRGPEIKEVLARVHEARLDGTVASASEEIEFIKALRRS